VSGLIRFICSPQDLSTRHPSFPTPSSTNFRRCASAGTPTTRNCC
jgi:hypothetical protein